MILSGKIINALKHGKSKTLNRILIALLVVFVSLTVIFGFIHYPIEAIASFLIGCVFYIFVVKDIDSFLMKNDPVEWIYQHRNDDKVKK